LIGTAKKRFRVHGFTILQILHKIEERFKMKGIQNPRLDAEALLSKVLRLDRVGLYREYDRILTDEEVNLLSRLVERRLSREPLQYILGTTEFYGLEFLVTPDVFIPRPETELLVDEALKLSRVNHPLLTILDLCTGSGCIAIAIAKSLKNPRIYATDISRKALKVARENAKIHRVEDKIVFIEGDLFRPFTPLPKSSPLREEGWVRGFDLIVSNPPYIPSHEIELLQMEVKGYEPRMALNGGPDGLLYSKKIIEEAPSHLRSGGSLLLEIGEGQGERVSKAIAERDAYHGLRFIKDYAGLDRVVVAVKT